MRRAVVGNCDFKTRICKKNAARVCVYYGSRENIYLCKKYRIERHDDDRFVYKRRKQNRINRPDNNAARRLGLLARITIIVASTKEGMILINYEIYSDGRR